MANNLNKTVKIDIDTKDFEANYLNKLKEVKNQKMILIVFMISDLIILKELAKTMKNFGKLM